MISFFLEEPLEDCFVTKNEVVMEGTSLLSLPEGMQVSQIQITENGLVITVVATHPTSCCPLCSQRSSSIKSHYQRTLRDVPCAGRRVQLLLTVRKFYCRNPICERKVFAERLPAFVEPWARMTIRYCEQITSIGLATCGKGGVRLAARLGIHITRQTILRRIMDLPDMQCVDRFHLLKNLGEALEDLLARHLSASRKQQVQKALEEQAPAWPETRKARRSGKAEEVPSAYQQDRMALYQQVISLHEQGMTQSAIAEQIGVHLRTVQRWLAAGAFPEPKRHRYVSQLDPYLPYIFQRWEQGCHNMARLFQELVARGYQGSYASVRDNLVRRLQFDGRKTPGDSSLSKAPALPTSRQAAFLFLHRPEKLRVEEQEQLCKLRQIHPEVDRAYDLVQQFAQMLRTRTGERLDAWLAQVQCSNLPELQSFAAGVEKDKDAVRAGLTWWINNGMVEGHVTKLKLIKRQGYGRAEFPLLRKRVLHAV